MKNCILSLFLLISTVVVKGAAISVSGAATVEFKLSTTRGGGNLSLTGGGVAVGFFNGYTPAMNGSIADPTSSVLAFLSQTFVPIGVPGVSLPLHGQTAGGNPLGLRATTGGGTTAGGSIINSNWLSATPTMPANFLTPQGLVRGTRLFVVAYNGTSIQTATDIGIYSASQWTIPTNVAVVSVTLMLTAVDTPSEVFRGELGSLVLAPVVVPEPGSSALVCFGLGVMAIARRRRV